MSISAYRRTVLDVQGSAQLTDDPLYTISSVAYEKSAQMSQEFQLLSLPGARINWTTGTYIYYDNAGSTPPTIESGGLVAPFSNIYVFDHRKRFPRQSTAKRRRRSRWTLILRSGFAIRANAEIMKARREDSHKFGHSDVPPKKSEYGLAIDDGIIPI